MSEVRFFPVDRLEDHVFRYAVVATRYGNRWMLCRHKARNTWELPGGHCEIGETPLETAQRELYEETGITDAQISIVGGYHWNDNGLLCFAEVNSLGHLPPESEIAETMLFEILPEELTYKETHTKLFDWVQNWLNMQNSADELWDVYDENRKLTGRLHRRGDYMTEGDYHLTVHIWMMNSRGEFLMTKRSPNKGFPNKWETTGGSAVAGDDSLTAALREVREETGLHLNPDCGQCLFSLKADNNFADIWLFKQDFDLNDVVLLEGETCDVMYADWEQITKLQNDGMLVPYSYLSRLRELMNMY